MIHPYQLKLRSTVHLMEDGDDLLIACRDGRGLRNRQPGSGIRALLNGLTRDEQSAEQLIQCALAAEAKADISRLYFLLANLEKKGFLNYTLAEEGRPLATLEPISPAFRFVDAQSHGALRLSRFACLRRDGDVMVLESPLGHSRLVLHDSRLCVLPALLAAPRSLDELTAALPDFARPLLEAMISLLINAGVLFSCDSEGSIAEDTDAALRQWEFHDLLFHSRSRPGRQEYPLGATYRFKGKLPHVPALKAAMSEDCITLDRPASNATGPDFFAVLEARRSQHVRGKAPLTHSQVGEFLWYSARVQVHIPADPQNPSSYEATQRPYPSGGAMHELELYLTVSRCTGLEPGLYHYDPQEHELERLADLGKQQQSMVQDAMNSSGLKQPPDVLISLAARFGRVAWKYEGVAYALTLKNVGCLYQQMYLVATALGLSPCALGAGNSDTFAQASGIDYFAETSVGDFMLSSTP